LNIYIRTRNKSLFGVSATFEQLNNTGESACVELTLHPLEKAFG